MANTNGINDPICSAYAITNLSFAAFFTESVDGLIRITSAPDVLIHRFNFPVKFPYGSSLPSFCVSLESLAKKSLNWIKELFGIMDFCCCSRDIDSNCSLNCHTHAENLCARKCFHVNFDLSSSVYDFKLSINFIEFSFFCATFMLHNVCDTPMLLSHRFIIICI